MRSAFHAEDSRSRRKLVAENAGSSGQRNDQNTSTRKFSIFRPSALGVDGLSAGNGDGEDARRRVLFLLLAAGGDLVSIILLTWNPKPTPMGPEDYDQMVAVTFDGFPIVFR